MRKVEPLEQPRLLTPEEVEATLPRLAALCADRPIALLYLYGSHAKGTQNDLSDIDIGVQADLPRQERRKFYVGLLDDLIALFDREDIDLVLLNDVGPMLRYRIVCDGRPVYRRSERDRIAFECRAVKEYFDFKPYSEVYDRALFKAVREGRFFDRAGDHRRPIRPDAGVGQPPGPDRAAEP